MELRLLGPFEVEAPGSLRRLPGQGERALLALLGLSAGAVVPVSTLMDALWGPNELPADPANALQVRVSKLRRALGAPDLVERDGSGYRLDVDRDAVDTHRFAALIEVARRTGDPHLAVDAYGQALTLWRGEPLADFAGAPWAVIESGRLTELRLAALSERADRLLTLGRFDQVVAELEPVAAADPTRERLVGQLMTALFNAGRQADALDAFARTRHALSEDLGLDPSRGLRTVLEQVLRQDTAVAAAVRVPVASAPAGNLPLRVTTFVGRERERERVDELLARSRLVTLAGPGGAGKTTLGIEAARAAAGRFRDGVWLVRLAAVTEREMLTHAVADALGLSIEGGTVTHHPREVLVQRLAERELLIVMDNCEHLIEPVASLVETIMGRCPGTRVLATSREALAVPGEIQVPVAPLPVPRTDTPAQRVGDYAAARLFLDRAEAASAGPVVDEEALVAVSLICRRLDGIPLALELAAARLSSLTPVELADRVQDRFAVLTTGSRTAEARQQTLRGAVDWSHDLLTEVERVLFRRLAVFRGGWTLAAAEAVVTGTDLPRHTVLDVLDRLVRQSLVDTDATDGHTRYRMLETLRQYAEDRLDRAGERESLAAAHAAHYGDIGEQAESLLRGPSQGQWLTGLRAEHPNLRQALSWLLATPGHADAAMRLAGSLGLYWHMGRHLEGRQVLRRVLALPGGSPQPRARALQALSLVERPRACIVHPSEQCAAAARNSLAIFEAAGDRPRAAFSRLLLAVEGVGSAPGVDAPALLEQADREFAALDDRWGRAVVSFVRMEALFQRGDEPTARTAAERAVEQFRALGDGWGLSAVLYHYGFGVQRFGAHADAVPLLEEAIAVAGTAGVHNTVQWATADLGLALLALGRIEEASACFARAGAVSDQVGDQAGRLLGTYGEALAAVQNGDHARARPLFADALAGFERLGVSSPAGRALAGLALCDVRLGHLEAARAGYGRLLTLARTSSEVGLLAVALEGSARTAVESDPGVAAELLGQAAWLRRRYDRPATADEHTVTESTSAIARSALGEPAYEAATGRGAAAGRESDAPVTN